MYQIPLMCLLLKEIEFRRLVKNLIRKISTKIFWSLIKSKNLEIIMKNFSWVFLDEYRLIVNYKKPIDYKKPLGFILLDSNDNRCIDVIKNSKFFYRNSKTFSYSLFSRFFHCTSNFTFTDIKIIDSFFQIKKKFSKFLPIIFPIGNFYGSLLSLSELLRILFLKFIRNSRIHKVSFLKIKNLILKFIQKFEINLPNKKIRLVFLNILLRKKIR